MPRATARIRATLLPSAPWDRRAVRRNASSGRYRLPRTAPSGEARPDPRRLDHGRRPPGEGRRACRCARPGEPSARGCSRTCPPWPRTGGRRNSPKSRPGPRPCGARAAHTNAGNLVALPATVAVWDRSVGFYSALFLGNPGVFAQRQTGGRNTSWPEGWRSCGGQRQFNDGCPCGLMPSRSVPGGVVGLVAGGARVARGPAPERRTHCDSLPTRTTVPAAGPGLTAGPAARAVC